MTEQIDYDNIGEFRDKIVGQSIEAFECRCSGENMCDNTTTITLANGDTLEFVGIGYDASSLVINYEDNNE